MEATPPLTPHRPSISVIIPAYNASAFVGRAIESALAQTYAPLEILVVDDGSRDETAEVVARYPAPVRLLRQENGGPAAARNHGARVARGEWLALLDADDAWLPQKLEKQLPFTQDPGVGLVHCRQDMTSPATFEMLWQRNRILTSTVLIRRTVFEQLGGFDEDRALICVEDYNLWLRLAASGWQISACPEKLCEYTPAPGSLSRQVERFACAEMANLEKIARLLAIDAGHVRSKRAAIYEEYGRDLIYCRDIPAARRLLRAALGEQLTVRRLGWWLATFVPLSALDLRRRVVAHVQCP